MTIGALFFSAWYDGAVPFGTSPFDNDYDSTAPPIGAFAFLKGYGIGSGHINCTPGNAVADGVTASITLSQIAQCEVGNAVADGVTCTIIAAAAPVDDPGRSGGLPQLMYAPRKRESEADKLRRRIKLGIIKPENTVEEVSLSDDELQARKEAIHMEIALQAQMAEAAQYRAQIERMEAMQRDRNSKIIEQQLLRKRQEEQMAQLQAEAAQEHAEMIDVAYAAKQAIDAIRNRKRS